MVDGMSSADAAWLELGAFALILTMLTPVLGGYMSAVFAGSSHPKGRGPNGGWRRSATGSTMRSS